MAATVTSAAMAPRERTDRSLSKAVLENLGILGNQALQAKQGRMVVLEVAGWAVASTSRAVLWCLWARHSRTIRRSADGAVKVAMAVMAATAVTEAMLSHLDFSTLFLRLIQNRAATADEVEKPATVAAAEQADPRSGVLSS